MKTRVKSRFSLGMKIVGILSCLAIVSVGFAAWWVIKLPEPKTLESGSFTVYAVDEKNIEFSDISAEGNADITFGAPETPEGTGWLGYTGIANDHLTAILKFTVSVNDANDKLSNYLDGITVEFNPGAVYSSLLADNVKKHYVAEPEIYYQVDGTDENSWNELTNNLVPAPASDSADVYLKFVFKWGDATENENPYNYFNDKTIDEDHALIEGKTNKEVALDMLGAVRDLNTNKYNVKITATAKAANNG